MPFTSSGCLREEAMNQDNELVSKHLQRPFGRRERALVIVGLGLCGAVLAWLEYVQPSAMPFTGKWGWAKELMHTYLGLHGVAIGTGLIAFLFVLWGGYDLATSDRGETS